jgi:phospholipid/cholesterol/gamma-HCH transport system substrate-binding protein
MSKETKIGILALVTAFFGTWGYMFLKGRNILSRERIVWVSYKEVSELTESSPVTVNGFQVGVVSKIKMDDTNASRIWVGITLRRDINIPKNAVAELVSSGLMGGRNIKITFEKPCSGNDCVEASDTLRGVAKGMMASMMSADELTEYMSRAKGGVRGIMDSLDASFKESDSETGKTLRDIQATIENLKRTTAALNGLIQVSAKSMGSTMNNLESVTKNLERSNGEITQLMANTKDFTGKLNKLELDKTVGGANDAMASIKKTLDKTDKAMAEMNTILEQARTGNGSLNQLLYDDKLVKNINETMLSLDMLSRDLNLHPKRYRSVIWGRERKRVPFVQDVEYQKYMQDRDSIKAYNARLKSLKK